MATTSDAQLLAELKTAYQKVLTGKHVSVIQKDGRKVEYSALNVSLLQAEISRLEVAVNGSTRRARPARLF